MRLIVLIYFITTSSFAQRFYFNSYDAESLKYTLCIMQGDSIEQKIEGVFLGGNWKISNSNPIGCSPNSIYEFQLINSEFSRINVYRTDNFIQDFYLTKNYIFTIESSNEQYLYDDSKCFRVTRKNGKKVRMKPLSGKNLYAIYGSHFSDSLIFLEKNEKDIVVGLYDQKREKYEVIYVFKLEDDVFFDLNIHNRIVWTNSSTIAMLVKNNQKQKYEVWEFNTINGSKIIIPTKMERLVDFDFFKGNYYFLGDESNVSSIDGKIISTLISDGHIQIISGFRMTE